jgi:hypothetical protein
MFKGSRWQRGSHKDAVGKAFNRREKEYGKVKSHRSKDCLDRE